MEPHRLRPQNSDVLPHLRDKITKYHALLDRGIAAAEEMLAYRVAMEGPVPSNESLQLAHRVAFAQVSPLAGEFRRSGEEVALRSKQGKIWEAAFSRTIEPELEKLRTEVNDTFPRAKSTTLWRTFSTTPASQRPEEVQEVGNALAFCLAKLAVIHPVRFGNEMFARTLLNAQMRHCLGAEHRRLEVRGDDARYEHGVRKARETRDLAPLAAYATGIELDQEHRQSKHAVEVWPQVIHRSLDGELTLPCKADNLRLATQFDQAWVHHEVASYLRTFGAEGMELDMIPGSRGDRYVVLKEPSRIRIAEHELLHGPDSPDQGRRGPKPPERD